ncbi:calcium-binding protein [Nocardioides sp. HB32]
MRIRVLTASIAGAACVTAVALPATADSVRGSRGSDDVVGTARADTIVTFSGDDHVDARAGDDVVRLGPTGRHGDEYARGGTGDDTLYGGPGRDHLTGGPGDDWLRGGSGLDLLVDNGGSDHFSGGAGPDQAYLGRQGSARNETDVVHMGPGRDFVVAPSDHQPDIIDCGRGAHDRLTYERRPDPSDTVRGCEIVETIRSGDGIPARPAHRT